MKSFFLNHPTANGLPIPAYSLGGEGPQVLILGGVHGDEREGVEAAYGLLDHWQSGFPYRVRLIVVPALNMDGVIRSQRGNGRGIDLNRNMGTNDWTPDFQNPRYNPGPFANSEPETKGLIDLVGHIRPQMIFSLHSWHPVLNVNGDCLREANMIAQWTGYSVSESIGYPTPGCLGTYCGLEREMPTLTYEIERGLPTRDILAIHVPAICEALKVTELTRRKNL